MGKACAVSTWDIEKDMRGQIQEILTHCPAFLF
jgi:hypothetical protein